MDRSRRCTVYIGVIVVVVVVVVVEKRKKETEETWNNKYKLANIYIYADRVGSTVFYRTGIIVSLYQCIADAEAFLPRASFACCSFPDVFFVSSRAKRSILMASPAAAWARSLSPASAYKPANVWKSSPAS